ncbi:hypothetical protein RSAG8_01414, partial [Rhizoctonia solani AG-8 WAC10335]
MPRTRSLSAFLMS